MAEAESSGHTDIELKRQQIKVATLGDDIYVRDYVNNVHEREE